jgi:hypothetical protein
MWQKIHKDGRGSLQDLCRKITMFDAIQKGMGEGLIKLPFRSPEFSLPSMVERRLWFPEIFKGRGFSSFFTFLVNRAIPGADIVIL